MKNLNYIDTSLEWYNLKYDSSYRFYIKATKPDYNSTRLLVKDIYMKKETAIIFLVKPERLKEENLSINTYDFETSTVFYNLVNNGARQFIIADNFGNALYEFNARWW